MKYNPAKPFNEQDQEVQDYITTEVIDQTQEPAERDELKRPKYFLFGFKDEDNIEYQVKLTNVYIDNRSWRLHNQTIEVEQKVG